jgi:hypothetical protein
MFLQHWSLHNIEAYLCFLTSPPLQIIYMLNHDQTIWVTTEVLLGTPKGRQWGTFLEPDGNTLGTPPPKPNRKKLSPLIHVEPLHWPHEIFISYVTIFNLC